MRIAVVGLGYVGLVTSGCLTRWGHEVVGIEADPKRLEMLSGAQLPFYEPGLDELVREGRENGRLRFCGPLDAAEHLSAADVVIIAVGTHDGSGGWQTTTMTTCIGEVLPHVRQNAALVIRSTLPPDFIRDLPQLLEEIEPNGAERCPVLLNPEFTAEGTAVRDFVEPQRIVVGIVRDPSRDGERLLEKLYASAGAPILTMPAIDAALSKLGANLFLATKISFANELAALCDAFGADVTEVLRSMAFDPRIGSSFLRPGIGFGGSCLPNQVTMTVRSAEMIGHAMPLLNAVERVNVGQRSHFVELLATALGERVTGRRVALLGLTFKPGTDDLRDAPALAIARELLAQGATVVAYDPMPTARYAAAVLVPGLVVAESVIEAVRSADVIGLATEWPEFAALEWSHIRGLVAQPVIVDGRNLLDPVILHAAGFRYSAFGRRPVEEAPSELGPAIALALPVEEIPVPDALRAAAPPSVVDEVIW